jgi:hypothetical protein
MSTSSDSVASSVAASWRALVSALVATVRALGTLLLALGQAPFRRLRRPRPGRPTPASRTPIEVHLTDPLQGAEIERAVRATLVRCARTWAPRPLPFDRLEVLYGAPARGQASTYTRWAELPPADGTQRHRPLTVLSLGLTDDDGRALEPAEIAGAVAVQVRSVLARRYVSEHPEPAPEIAGEPSGPAAPSSTAITRGRAAPVGPAVGDPASSGGGTPAQVTPTPAVAENAKGRAAGRDAEPSPGAAATPLLRLLPNADPLQPSEPGNART